MLNKTTHRLTMFIHRMINQILLRPYPLGSPPRSKLKYESPDINKLKALETSFGLPTEQLFPASLCNLDLSFPICTDDVGSTSNEPDKRQ
jgi:hypothetical protein